uniref:Complex III subunit 9 n=1 Tax=Talaromyces marneffei PM1 TaxID=1077442 RepID=A0A093V8P8_TALMA
MDVACGSSRCACTAVLCPVFSVELDPLAAEGLSTVTLHLALCAFACEVAFDTASNKIWDTMNRGRQWKDIRHQYIQKAEEDEDEE